MEQAAKEAKQWERRQKRRGARGRAAVLAQPGAAREAAAQVRTMPSGTLAASQARASAFMQILYNRKRGL